MQTSHLIPHLRRASAFLLAFCMLFAAVSFGSTAVRGATTYSDATTKSLQEQIDALKAEQNRIAANLTKLRKERNSVNEYKQEMDTYLAVTDRKIEAGEMLLDELNGKIEVKTQEIETNTAEYEKTYQKFLDMMVLSYEEGNASYIGLILGADSLGDFLSRVERVSSMLDYNNSVMHKLDEIGKSLAADKAALEKSVEQQKQTQEELALERADYEAKSEQALAAMLELQKDEAQAQKEYYAKKAAEEKLDKELEEYIAEQQRKNQAAMEAGDWAWPLPLDSGAYASSRYGWRYLWGSWDYHRGWDLACWLGTDIYAAKSGTVLIATYHYSYGNYVVIDHGDGISTVYGHCSKLLVSAGDKVKKGDLIAKVGTTGNSSGYHLHFEFRRNGKHTDPFEFIPNPPISVPASKFTKD